MPQDATCPGCKHTFPVTEARHPFTVACPRCESHMTVEFKKPATAPEPGEPHYELRVKPGALPGTGGPPPVPKRRTDDDEVRGGGSMAVVLVSGGLGLLFVLCGLGITGWFLFTQVDVSSGYTNRSGTRPTNGSGTGTGTFTPARPNPVSPKLGGTDPIPGGTKLPKVNPWEKTKTKSDFGGGEPFVPPPPPPVEPEKAKDTFELRPVPGKLDEIKPPTDLKPNAPKTVLLPGRAEGVSVGGGGRYIVLTFPDQGRIEVFDANTGDLIEGGTIDTGAGRQVAAGANKVAVSTGKGHRFRVYTLPDLKPQNEFEMSLFAGPRGLAMGAATNGPLMGINPFAEVELIDLVSGRAIEGSKRKIDRLPANELRATADGKLFLAGNGFNNGDKFVMVDEDKQRWRTRHPNLVAGYPGPDGKKFYGKDAILGPTGNTLATKPKNAATFVWYVPAVTATGDYFLGVTEKKAARPGQRDVVAVALMTGTDVDKYLMTWEGLPELEGLASQFFQSTQPLDRHLFLIPEAKLLVILNKDRTLLTIRKLAI